MNNKAVLLAHFTEKLAAYGALCNHAGQLGGKYLADATRTAFEAQAKAAAARHQASDELRAWVKALLGDVTVPSMAHHGAEPQTTHLSVKCEPKNI